MNRKFAKFIKARRPNVWINNRRTRRIREQIKLQGAPHTTGTPQSATFKSEPRSRTTALRKLVRRGVGTTADLDAYNPDKSKVHAT